MEKIKFVYKDPRTLRSSEKHLRTHTEEDRNKMRETLRMFGFVVPVVIAGDVLVTGEMRVPLAVELGMESIPTVEAAYMTEEQVRAFRALENKAGEWGKEDLLAVAEELAQLEIDMGAFWDEEDLADMAFAHEDIGDKLPQIYEVIVSCTDESHMEQVYNKLTGEGLECRVSTL